MTFVIVPYEKISKHIGCNRTEIKDNDELESTKTYLTYFPLTEDMEEYFKYFVPHIYDPSLKILCCKCTEINKYENNQPISTHTEIGFSLPDEETAFYFKLKFC